MRSALHTCSLPERLATTLAQSLHLRQKRNPPIPQRQGLRLSPADRYNQVPFHQVVRSAPISSVLLRHLRLAPPTLDHSHPRCQSCLDRIPCFPALVSRTS